MGQVLPLFENDVVEQPALKEIKKKAVSKQTNISKRQALRVQAVEVLEFLNNKTGRKYRPVDVNLNMIMARIESGISVEQLRMIVAMKSREWKSDPVMNKYLRPSTLFNEEKCEQYFGELL